MYNAAYIGGDDRHIINSSLDVVSAGHIIIDETSAAVSGPNRPNGFPDYQLLYIKKGKGHFLFADGERVIGAGSVVLYFPNEPQIYRYLREEKAEVFWLHFGGRDAAALMEELSLCENRVISLSRDGEIPSLIGEVITELRLQKSAFSAVCRAALIKILTELSRHRLSVDQSGDELIERVCKKIDEEYENPLRSEALAEYANMSLSSFAHQFKKKTGISPGEYILRRRLSAACFLLQNTDIAVGVIARETGFSDALYFSKFFRARMGKTPTDYRNNYSERAEN